MRMIERNKGPTRFGQVISVLLVTLSLFACSGGKEEPTDSDGDNGSGSNNEIQVGVVAHVYDLTFERLPDFITLTPSRSETFQNIQLNLGQGERIGVVYLAELNVTSSGTYNFSIQANSDFRLIVNETVLTQSIDVTNTSTIESDSIQLSEGINEFRLEYVEASTSSVLNVTMNSTSQTGVEVDENLLTYKSTHLNPAHNHVPLEIPGDDDSGDGDGDGSDDGSDPELGPCDNTDTVTGNNSLRADQQLDIGDSISSTDNAYRLALQSDGNLVLRRVADGEALWASGTNGSGATRVRMQGDGNLVIRAADGSAVWSSQTAGTGPAYLILHNDGNLAIYSENGARVWETSTSDGSLCETVSVNPIDNNFSTPSSSELFGKANKTFAFPEVIGTSFEGNGHSVSWDGRVYVVKRTQGWFAQVLRPENITKNQQGIPSFSNGAFSSRFLMLANEDAPELQVNWLAIVIDPAAGLENPYPSDSAGNYSESGNFETYKALVYVTSTLNGDNDQLGVRKATFIVKDAKTADAAIQVARFDSEFERFQTNDGADVRCIEPSATIDGRLVICQGHPANDGRIDNLVYSWNNTPGATENWTESKSVANMYWDDRETLVNGMPFSVRYPIAEKPLVDATGEVYMPGQLVKGAYPWISRDGSELFYQASRDGVPARRTGTSVVGRWTGWIVRHIDGPINPQRGLSRLFLSSPGAFTTMWSPFKDTENLAIPYSAPGPVYPIFGSNSHDYSEVSFNDYLDGDFILYYGMNEQLNREGTFQVTRTNDTSGHFNNGTLVGAKFPNEYNNQDQLVGRVGQAIYFPANSYIEVSKNSGWNLLNSQMSVDFWLNKISGSGQIRLFTMENGLEVYLQNGNQLVVSLSDTNGVTITSSASTIESNQWVHIGVSIDAINKVLNVYVNGENVKQQSISDFGNLNTAGNVAIGLINSTGLAILDEVKVSKVARTDEDMRFYANKKTLPQVSTLQLDQVPNHLSALKTRINPITDFSLDAASLGETLFFDTILSKSNSTSCGTCHKRELHFTDSVAIAEGLEPTDAGTRNAPMLLNRMFSTHQGWSGSAQSLAEQALQPIAAEHEMNLPIAEAVERLTNDANYSQLFNDIFGRTPNSDDLATALASFQSIQFSPLTRFDQMNAGDNNALSQSEKRGKMLFDTKARCSGCHSGTNFTDESFRNTGIVKSNDVGRSEITGKERDKHLFKVPSLRGLIKTAPYMHDGSFATIAEVVEAYDEGVVTNTKADTDIKPLELTPQEKADLVAFLMTL
ncbi:MAG: c-type cytochrome [Gammaproteobacteria bacterium]|nr:c-type cytochrome [Gammaproteobacteria bacterium]